jgi:SRSO17 transposase
MADFMNAAAVGRLESYFERIGEVLGSTSRRGSFATYAMGLFGDGERKSVEPIAARACGDPARADAEHQRLLHFIANSSWCDRDVRLEASRFALAAMTDVAPIQAWIIDDTGFLKQGKHSVGVQRQYTGSAGKIANCQIAVSLTVATQTEHLPIDFRLYLPEAWTSDAARRRASRIPDDVQFKTKLELALDMIRSALDAGIPQGVVLGDCAYGNSTAFREQIRWCGLHYALGVESKTKVWLLDKRERRYGEPVALCDLAQDLWSRRRFRRSTWRKGTNDDLWARFAMVRVLPAHDDGWPPEQREPLWLLMEWRDGDDAPANYYFSSLPKRITKRKLLRIAMQRWRTERVYQDLKGELGLDHFEGRLLSGWNHHISVALCCYAFVIAERVRRFPPSAGRPMEAPAQLLAA